MTALPKVLISILQPSLKLKATHVEVSDEHVVLFRGEKEIARGDSPDGGCARFAELMRALSAEVDGGHRRAEFQTPEGKLYATVEIAPELVRLVFAADSPVLIATQFNEFLDYAAGQGAQKIAFTTDGAPIWKDEQIIGVGEINATLMPGFIAHVRELTNMEEGENEGTAFLLGDNANVILHIEIADRNGQPAIFIRLG